MFTQMTLNQFLLSVKLGWPVDERARHQVVAVDIMLRFKHPPSACDTDNLENTVCYNELTKTLKQGINNKSFRLIESLTKELYLLTKSALDNTTLVTIKVTKKPAIENLTEGVTFIFGDFM